MALTIERKIYKYGGSHGIIIPKTIMQMLKAKEGDIINVTFTRIVSKK